MADLQCSCGADTKKCEGTLQHVSGGGDNLWCDFCHEDGGCLDHGNKPGDPCLDYVCTKTEEPPSKCSANELRDPGIPFDDGILPDDGHI